MAIAQPAAVHDGPIDISQFGAVLQLVLQLLMEGAETGFIAVFTERLIVSGVTKRCQHFSSRIIVSFNVSQQLCLLHQECVQGVDITGCELLAFTLQDGTECIGVLQVFLEKAFEGNIAHGNPCSPALGLINVQN